MSRITTRWTWTGVLALLLAALMLPDAMPVHSASDLAIYTDSLATDWEDWSWDSTIDVNQTGVFHAGTKAVAVTYTAANGGFSLRHATPIATTGYTTLEFWAYGAAGGSPIVLYTQSTDDGGLSTFYNFTAPAGVWTKYSVPLVDFGSPAQIARINWQDGTTAPQAVYYIDDVRLVAAPVATGYPDATADGTRSLAPGPSGVALAPNGRVYVAVYQDNRVYSWATVAAMTAGSASDKTFGGPNGDPDAGCTNGPSATVLCGPESVAVDAAGNLYVADTYNHRVVVFYNPDTDASPLSADFVIGQPAGNLNSGLENYDSNNADGIVEGLCFVRGLALDAAGNLYVADESNHRVLKFTTPLATDTLPDLVLGRAGLGDISPCPTTDAGPTHNAANRFNWPLGVAVDGDGNVYVADMRNNRVQRFNVPLTNGQDATTTYGGFTFPHDVAIDPFGRLYVADTLNARVRVFAPGDTTHDHEFPGLAYPMGMAFTGKGDFVLADCGKPAPGDPDAYPPCVTNPRGVYVFNAPTAPNPDPDPDPDPGANITLQVNAGANRKPISPYIYGINDYGLPGDPVAYLQALGIPLRRWGGNATSRYNYLNDISNHAFDWFFGNVKQSDAANLPADSAVNRLIAGNKQAGADTLLVIPASGYVANDNPVACGFSVAKYGAQKATAALDGRPDCGNGILANDTPVTGNNPLDTSLAVTEQFAKDWIAYLIGRYGAATGGGVRFYNLDNEPDIWFETHRDIRPTGMTYDQFAAMGTTYGAAIKAADPTAQVLGPVVNGWTYYWHAPYDGQREDWATPDDRLAHGDMPFVPWYLQQMKAYQDANGVRILDYLDLHYYPQSGVALTGSGDAGLQAKRLRSTRSLWDPTYVDESWIKDAGPDGGIVKLIPRMREWVAANYPGTKLAIGEYNWGALDDINGALAQADVLGIFGREGVDMAALWQPPGLNDPGAFAFRLYRNYDGKSSRFGDTGVQATSSDQGQLAVYAAQRTGDNALTVMVINKTGGALTGQVQLSNFTPGGPGQVYRYSAADLTKIVRPADQAVTGEPPGPGFTAAFPGNSITLVVIPAAGGPGPNPNPNPDPDPAASVFLPMTQR